MNRKDKVIQSKGDRPKQVPSIFAWLGSVVSVALIIITHFLPCLGNPYLRGTGVFMLLLSGVFIFTPFYLLAKFGGTKDQKTYMQSGEVVDRGLYAITRHPQYLGYSLLGGGFALLSQHWAAVLLAGLGFLFFYLQAVKRELLLTQSGSLMCSNLKRVPRFNILLGILRYLRGGRK